MSQDRSLKFMVFMMSVAANMAIQMFGNVLLNSLTTFLSQLSSKISSSVYMEVSHQVSKLWIISVLLKDSKKCHTKGQCAICCGVILMIELAGE